MGKLSGIDGIDYISKLVLEQRTDEAAKKLVDGNPGWFRPFGDEEFHFAQTLQEVILAKAFRRLSVGMRQERQEGRRQAATDALI